MISVSSIKSIRTLGKIMMLGRKRAASESCAYPEPVVSNDGNGTYLQVLACLEMLNLRHAYIAVFYIS